jgi:hypothetical protein
MNPERQRRIWGYCPARFNLLYNCVGKAGRDFNYESGSGTEPGLDRRQFLKGTGNALLAGSALSFSAS